jgi:hypothetical protein
MEVSFSGNQLNAKKTSAGLLLAFLFIFWESIDNLFICCYVRMQGCTHMCFLSFFFGKGGGGGGGGLIHPL